MQHTIDKLDARDRAHVESMLARYGLTGDPHMRGHLVVPAHATLHLDQGKDTSGTHLVLRTSDLDVVKRWIGTPDSVFHQGAPCQLTAPTTVIDLEKDLCQLDAAEAQALRDAARRYIYGDSRQVGWYKRALEKYFAPFSIPTYIYTTLDVRGELKFSDPAALLLANTILFHPGGTIVSSGNLSIQATYIAKQSS
ncbi:hypothetical protein [Sorangium sp. So ce1335]|uniref:hypothetical protein n=1 Tax=Sorangium sp. So ce1335 TaxID=3133335 RepID=UPI003F6000B3